MLPSNHKDKFIDLGKSEKKIETKIKIMAEAERARFEAKLNGEKPKLRISYGFSDIDPSTNVAFTWDLYIRFPFKVPKQKCEEFKEEIQRGFEKIFLS